MPFTVFTVVFITNAINLIDGIDGLASGLSSVALLIFTFLFVEKGLWSYACWQPVLLVCLFHSLL